MWFFVPIDIDFSLPIAINRFRFKGDSVQFSGASRYNSTASSFTVAATTVGKVFGTALGEAAQGTIFAGAGVSFGLIVDNVTTKPRAYVRIAFVDKVKNIPFCPIISEAVA
jgi:hypothetical protein